jgi:hypothetical protein
MVNDHDGSTAPPRLVEDSKMVRAKTCRADATVGLACERSQDDRVHALLEDLLAPQTDT